MENRSLNALFHQSQEKLLAVNLNKFLLVTKVHIREKNLHRNLNSTKIKRTEASQMPCLGRTSSVLMHKTALDNSVLCLIYMLREKFIHNVL